jgi:mono/diheme cytochrome c family protein
MKSFIILSFVALLVIFFALSSGAYNMAATEKHWTITEKIITWVRESSIEVRAKDLEVPTIDETDIFLIGAEHYNAMCTICHLAPGRKPTELATGLYPQAPVFHERTPVTDTEEKLHATKEYFWVIKNGIKMTAMPAWGPTHDDESIWATAAFVLTLHGMTTEQYEALTETDHHGHQHEDDHGHQH